MNLSNDDTSFRSALPAERFDMIELSSLRSEILLRMLVQNLILVLLMPLLLATFLVQLALPAHALFAALGYCTVAGIGALIWCHHGVRQAQIKGYLLVLEQRHASRGGWESWLPNHRIGGVLGARWFISTKGALLGSQVAALLAGMLQGGGDNRLLFLLATAAAIAGTAFFLLFNPKESLQPIPETSR